jgi:tetratricopeptide (TPR) repeat protein
MYYRYKVTKKKKKGFKTLFIILLVVLISYLIYSQRQYLIFWKYTSNKMLAKIEKLEHIADLASRKEGLEDLAGILEKYRKDNPVDPDAFFMSGKVHFLLGETCLGEKFTDLIINETYQKISDECIKELVKSIIYVKKGQTLYHDEKIPLPYAMILARANFYTSSMTIDAIYSILDKTEAMRAIREPEDVRFVAVIIILSGKQDYGLKLLTDMGDVTKTVKGTLFLAASEVLAKQYTGAIVHYKKVLENTGDPGFKKLAHVNLGKLYYNQSLFNESLQHLTAAGGIDNRDFNIKIWTGKTYYALGFKDRAKAIWNEVLALDRTNIEVKKLLGIM